MFGFERGAFTDARRAKPGLFQTAHRGTIFLDEVGLLPEALQAKLLKVLEERAVRRLGSTRDESVDVWILTATNEDLRTAVRARRRRACWRTPSAIAWPRFSARRAGTSPAPPRSSGSRATHSARASRSTASSAADRCRPPRGAPRDPPRWYRSRRPPRPLPRRRPRSGGSAVP